ncbi:MAG: hypothetical protein HY821_03280 [Acidobacteria bacterium]|nr:hypothetical protein [Acidobacteriota bacterium]
MRLFRPIHPAAIIACATAALAFQGLLPSLGWTEQDKTVICRQGLLDDGFSSLPGTYTLKAPVKTAWAARPAADRVALVREFAALAKSTVMAPAFEKTYDTWIKERYGAVNHGLKVDPQAEMQKMQKAAESGEMMSQIGAQMAASFQAMPMQSLQILFPEDLKKWQRSRDPKEKKLGERAAAIEPLMKSNPDEFKKQYALLKSIEMGGPDTMAGVQAGTSAAQKTQADQKAMQEQRNYDEHRLRAQLKKRLGDFIAVARTVDFNAQTTVKGGKIVFSNPAYESKSRAWKQLYRIGREPVQAGVAAAEAWLKEL